MDLEKLYKNFEVLDEWTDRYKLIIDLGRKLPEFPEEHRTEDNRVRGCSSKVWMVVDESRNSKTEMAFLADSDAAIVKGLIAVLMMVYSGKTTEEIVKVDIKAIFEKLGLGQHLSPTRSNGFFSMVEKIKFLSIQEFSKQNPS